MNAPARRKRRSGKIVRSYALAVFRHMEDAETLGAIDWLLSGNNQNPHTKGHARWNAYEKGFHMEQRATPHPKALRLPWNLNPGANRQ